MEITNENPISTVGYTILFVVFAFLLALILDCAYRVYLISNIHDNVLLMQADLLSYGKAHNGFNNSIVDDDYTVDVYIDKLLKDYKLEKYVNPSTDIILSPKEYTDRLEVISVSITYTTFSVIPTTPIYDLSSPSRLTKTITSEDTASGHIKKPNNPSNFELYEEGLYREDL